MKKKLILILIILSILALPVVGQAASSKSKTAPRDSSEDWGLVFDFDNLLTALAPYSDAVNDAGVGIKHWFKNNLAGRGLLYVLMEPDMDTHTTYLGASAACEFHLKPGRVSPYLGGILGCQFLLEPDQNYLDFFLGVLGGVEVRLFQNIGLFGEYQALVVRDFDGFWFKLGTDAVLGVIIYF